MAVTKHVIHENPEYFFSPDRPNTVFFSRAAAKRIFEIASSRGFEIWRYEGGIFKDDKFQPRLDSIWDRLDAHKGIEFLEAGNLRAALAIDDDPDTYNAYVITAGPMK